MAFSNTPTEIIDLGNGRIREKGTFNSAGVTTGTITAATASELAAAILPDDRVITKIDGWGFASDGDNAVTPAKDVDPNKIKIATTSDDTGDYYIEGFGK